MSGSALTLDFTEFVNVGEHFYKLQDPDTLEHVLDLVGALVVSQTQRRIRREQTSPDGTPWPDWSEGYAAHKHGAGGHQKHPGKLRSSGEHTMLMLSGHLVGAITHVVHDNYVEIGPDTSIIYGNVHQYGFPERNIPQRQFLGLSEDNKDDVQKVVEAYLEKLI